MTDLEITKACAEAMEIPVQVVSAPALGGGSWLRRTDVHSGRRLYDPLHDDGEAMALVKKFGLFISRLADTWYVDSSDGRDAESADHKDNLNRAICECVAKLQQAEP